MTEQEAISRAWAVIRQDGASVTGIREIRKLPETILPRSYSGKGDVWSVRFGIPVPDDCVISPDTIVVHVYDSTGEASIFLGL